MAWPLMPFQAVPVKGVQVWFDQLLPMGKVLLVWWALCRGQPDLLQVVDALGAAGRTSLPP